MRKLLGITAAIECATGVALLAAPAWVVELLLGVPLDTDVGLAIGRLAGIALFALGVACGGASRDTQSRAAAGVVAAMLFYNLGVVALLVWHRYSLGKSGIGLWPAVVLHVVLAAWCVNRLRARAV